jgi:hypothetical protein
MSFPDIRTFPVSHPGPYEEQMGEMIVGLLRLFSGRVPDSESNARVLELAATPERWSAGHKVFDEIRDRLLKGVKTKSRTACAQYSFEESCAQACYNAMGPDDPFDPGSPFFIAGQALSLAKVSGVPSEAVISILAP